MMPRRAFSLAQDVSSNDDGATMIEYAFMLSLIVVVAYGAVQVLGQSTQALFQVVVAAL